MLPINLFNKYWADNVGFEVLRVNTPRMVGHNI